MHSIYVMNELLAPQAGGYPLVNFSAQYTSILGYIFNILFASSGTLDQSVWFLTILAVGVAGALLLPLLRAYPNGKRYLAVLFTVPAIFIVKAKEDAYSGSISVLFSALPVRLLFPAIIVSILVTKGARNASTGTTALLAFMSSVAILNNVESGIVATLASAMVLVLAARQNCGYGSWRFLQGSSHCFWWWTCSSSVRFTAHPMSARRLLSSRDSARALARYRCRPSVYGYWSSCSCRWLPQFLRCISEWSITALSSPRRIEVGSSPSSCFFGAPSGWACRLTT
jgi:hypothetical protein